MRKNIARRHKVHPIAVRIMLAEAFMPVGARTLKDTKIMRHIAFIRASVSAKPSSVLSKKLGMKKPARAAVVEPVDHREFLDGLVVRIENRMFFPSHW